MIHTGTVSSRRYLPGGRVLGQAGLNLRVPGRVVGSADEAPSHAAWTATVPWKLVWKFLEVAGRCRRSRQSTSPSAVLHNAPGGRAAEQALTLLRPDPSRRSDV